MSIQTRGCGGSDCILSDVEGGQVVGTCKCLPRDMDPMDRIRLRAEITAQRNELRAAMKKLQQLTSRK